jgi:hypothetical protein
VPQMLKDGKESREKEDKEREGGEAGGEKERE